MVLEQLKTILVEKLTIEEEEIKLSSRLVDDLGADSLDVVEVIMEIEETFGIEVPDEKAEKLTTVKDIVEYIELAVKK